MHVWGNIGHQKRLKDFRVSEWLTSIISQRGQGSDRQRAWWWSCLIIRHVGIQVASLVGKKQFPMHKNWTLIFGTVQKSGSINRFHVNSLIFSDFEAQIPKFSQMVPFPLLLKKKPLKPNTFQHSNKKSPPEKKIDKRVPNIQTQMLHVFQYLPYIKQIKTYMYINIPYMEHMGNSWNNKTSVDPSSSKGELVVACKELRSIQQLLHGTAACLLEPLGRNSGLLEPGVGGWKLFSMVSLING